MQIKLSTSYSNAKWVIFTIVNSALYFLKPFISKKIKAEYIYLHVIFKMVSNVTIVKSRKFPLVVMIVWMLKENDWQYNQWLYLECFEWFIFHFHLSSTRIASCWILVYSALLILSLHFAGSAFPLCFPLIVSKIFYFSLH